MKAIKYFACIFLLTTILYPQTKIFIFDPIEVSSSFQYSFRALSSDGIFIDNTISNRIYNYDALFLFIGYQYALNQTEGELLIDYLETQRPIYVFAKLLYQPITEVTFWNFIGFEWYAELPLYVLVDSVVGTNTTFSSGVNIDTSFWSYQIPGAQGNISSLLKGIGTPMVIDVSYISDIDSINVIIDQYHQIYHPEFLRRVIEHFGLNLRVTNIQFFPPVDTALVNGGCTTPEIICKNLISTNERDSISIEPGFNTYFYYLDSSGYQVPLDNYYFIIIDSLDEYEYELWYYPKSFPPFEPVLIEFDSTFYSDQNNFNLQLIVKKDGIQIVSFKQPFHADFGLSVETTEEIPTDFNLSQNYPNPFNPKTSIQYAVSSRQFVSLIVYDILGNEIATLVNEEKSAGTYEVEFSPESSIKHPASGIYFYQLRAGNYVETKKMVLIK